NIVALFNSNEPGALFLGNAARSGIGYRFRNPQTVPAKRFKPKASHRLAGFSHQTLALPGRPQPKAAVLIRRRRKIDHADEMAGPVFEADGPTPLLAAFHGGQCNVPEKLECAIGRIWPRYFRIHIANNVPMREMLLNRRGIVKLKPPQDKPGGF